MELSTRVRLTDKVSFLSHHQICSAGVIGRSCCRWSLTLTVQSHHKRRGLLSELHDKHFGCDRAQSLSPPAQWAVISLAYILTYLSARREMDVLVDIHGKWERSQV
jgi:hypothetical protein